MLSSSQSGVGRWTWKSMARSGWSILSLRMDPVRLSAGPWCSPTPPCYHEMVRLSRDRLAVAAGLLAPLALAAILVPFRAHFQNTEAALALVVVIVAVAAAGNRLAGYLAALSAAAWFDFFLTRPYETFDITGRYDIETTVLLLVIGVAVTELAVWGRRQHTAASRRAGYLAGINAAAQSAAAGGSASALTKQVTKDRKSVV